MLPSRPAPQRCSSCVPEVLDRSPHAKTQQRASDLLGLRRKGMRSWSSFQKPSTAEPVATVPAPCSSASFNPATTSSFVRPPPVTPLPHWSPPSGLGNWAVQATVIDVKRRNRCALYMWRTLAAKMASFVPIRARSRGGPPLRPWSAPPSSCCFPHWASTPSSRGRTWEPRLLGSLTIPFRCRAWWNTPPTRPPPCPGPA